MSRRISQEEDEIPPIFVSFNGYSIGITCYSIISTSFFIKETIDEFNKIEFIVLKSEETLSPEAKHILEVFLSCSVEDLLTKTILSENDIEANVTFEFNEYGVEFLSTNLQENLEVELIRLLDCLDIKAVLIALVDYLVKYRGRNREEIIAKAKENRYSVPTIYIRNC